MSQHRYDDKQYALWSKVHELVLRVRVFTDDADPLYYTSAVGEFGQEAVDEAYRLGFVGDENERLYVTRAGSSYLRRGMVRPS